MVGRKSKHVVTFLFPQLERTILMKPLLKKISDTLRDMKNIIIVAHEKADGDALGSALALGRGLTSLGKKVYLAGFEPVPRMYWFLSKSGELRKPSNDFFRHKAEGLVVLDCTDLRRLSAFSNADLNHLKIINIDHHITNDRFGDVTWVGENVSSTGEMIFHLLRELNIPLTLEIAEPLWVAIVTDTGNFCFANTYPDTLRVAAELLAAGIDNNKIHRELRESKQLKDVWLMRRALEKLEVLENGKLGVIALTKDDFSEFSNGAYGLQDPVNLALMVDGVVAAAFISEQPKDKRIKVSLRGYEPYDVAKLSKRFGGGGHARAAGFYLKDIGFADAKGRVIAALQKMLSTTPK